MMSKYAIRAKVLFLANQMIGGSSAKSGLIGRFIRLLKRRINSAVEKRILKLLPGLDVVQGPFRGLRYPKGGACCSVWIPKIIGCYEAELHPVFEKIKGVDYRLIWDIGCAEGYYAIGLAMLYPQALVVGWDGSERALSGCREMAALNGVAGQVALRGFCSEVDMVDFDDCGRALIVCDCEGYEEDLISEATVSRLGRSDLIIEVHEQYRPGITDRLVKLLSQTHRVTLIVAISDEEKVSTYNYPPLDRMGTLERRYATSERRYCAMKWLFAEAKDCNPS
jgi:hypothetical protein